MTKDPQQEIQDKLVELLNEHLLTDEECATLEGYNQTRT